MAIFWLIAFVTLVFIELMTVNLLTIWFALGAVAAMISVSFTDSILIQSLVFVIVSIVALFVTKPLIKRFKVNEKTATNSDRVIGKRAEVTKKITADEYGEVKIFGTYWTAASDSTINVGTKVIVKDIEGVKLIVDKEEEK